ncbi:MAG: SRPBCC family protein [Micrococcaceae bacterium]
MKNQLDVNTSIEIKASAAQCFKYIVPVKLSHIFLPYLLLPGVEHTDEAERWIKPGLVRTVYFTDKSKATEQLLTVNPVQSFTYKITNFTGINRFLLKGINGIWLFSKTSDNETKIKWTYLLICHNQVTKFIAKFVVSPMLKAYLKRALQILKQDLENKENHA